MKISIYMALSANGMISSPQGAPDWLSPQFGEGFAAICARTQAVIMGRRTYDILSPQNLPLKDSGTTIVLTSRTDLSSPNPTVVFTDEKPEGVVGLLQERGHAEAVIVGGAMTVSEFSRAGLVTDLRLVVEPVLFGGGLPLITEGGAFEQKLVLREVAKVGEGTVRMHYEVRG